MLTIPTPDNISNNAILQPVVIILSSMTAILTGLLVTTIIAMFLCLIHARNKLRIANTDARSNPAVYDYVLTVVYEFHKIGC